MKRILSVFIAAAMLCSAIFCGCGKDEKQSEGSDITNTDSASDSVQDTTVKTTGGKVHINDNALGDIWITELDGVSVNKLDNNGFTSDNNYKYYSENGKPASVEGIDVSSYSGDIDWKKVKDSGIDFVMVRVGGRLYGDEGGLYADDRAIEYINGAKNEGLKVGAYFFSQAISNEEALEEADYVKEILGDIKLDYPVAFDWEIIKDDDARTDNVTATQATECARVFCERIESYGYTAMIYSPSRELYFKYDLTRLADYDIWYCEYSDVPTFYYEFSMWQYSSNGEVDGIEGAVDLNICFTNVAKYK